MRITLTIDDDVAALLHAEIERTGLSMNEAVNRLLRSSLQQATAPPTLKLFKGKAQDIGMPKEWTSGCVSELIEMLEGPYYK